MTYYFNPFNFNHRMARRMFAQAGYYAPDMAHTLAVDIRDTDEEFVLSALVPGLKAEDVNIQVLEDVVTIEGEYKQDESDYLVKELPQGSFRRSLRLPNEVEAGKVEAHIEDGVLTLRLPKAESARPKTIKVAVK